MLATNHIRKTILAAILLVPVFSLALTAHHLLAASCTLPSTNYGTDTATVSVPASGTYRIWTRMSVPSPATSSSTVMLQIDGTSCYTVGGSTIPTYASGATTFFQNDSSNWTSKTSAGTEMDVSLTSGNHTFELIGNAPGVVVDRLVLTQDTTCVPTGTGDNCANPPDTTPPVVSITSPASGANISSTTTVTANATDDVAVAKVAFYVDGTLEVTDTASPYTYSFNPANFSIGSHTLTAKAYDTSNNVATSAAVTVNVMDTTKPTVTLTYPTSGATVNGTITATVTASDNVGVTKVAYYLDNSTTSAVTSSTTAPFSASIDTTKLTNGTHTIAATASDAAGNSQTTAWTSFTVSNAPASDTTPPTISNIAPAQGATISGSSVVFSITATDASGIQQVQFYIDGVLKATDTATPYSYTFDSTALSNGTHTLKVTATDNSSNHNSASASVTVTVSNVTYIPEDINEDGHVNLQDFSLLSADYGHSGTAIITPRADINGDGTVNLLDFSLLASKYGT